jgi:hypothetical protein
MRNVSLFMFEKLDVHFGKLQASLLLKDRKFFI